MRKEGQLAARSIASQEEKHQWESSLQEVAVKVRAVAEKCQGDSQCLLALLRTLESLHREIRTELFEPCLPNTRNALYQLIREIEESGGWPYIERMKLQVLLHHLLPEVDGITAAGEEVMNNPQLTIPNPQSTMTNQPIKFGTDGWRGIIAADFTFDRVCLLAPLVAQVLADCYGAEVGSRRLIVGYDRRFLAEDFAQAAAAAVQSAGFDVLLSESYAPTPAFSWAAKAQNALGALVLTASHNPAKYLGLKVKGSFGGSVSPEVTQEIEARLSSPQAANRQPGTLTTFDPWQSYCDELRGKVGIERIREAIVSGQLHLIADVMHGAAAGGLSRLLGCPVTELHSQRDPLFGGTAPEPMPRYLSELFGAIEAAARQQPDSLRVGLVFDGDGDRIAAVDGQGNFLSSQVLIPVLIDHLAQGKGLKGEIVKTVSGSDLIPKLAHCYHLPLFETAIGYKYIADRMLGTEVLIGGEESGGIGYGTHIPERDALLSALYTLEAMVETGEDLGKRYRQLQEKVGFHSAYDRIDLPLANMAARQRLFAHLQSEPPQEVAGQAVIDCLTVDGYKFRLADGHWLLVRFSGTEPLLRLYCEAPTPAQVQETLNWAKEWASSI